MEKAIKLGKTEDSGKRGRPNARSSRLILQELSTAAEPRTSWSHSFTGSLGVGPHSMAQNTHTDSFSLFLDLV